MFCSNCGRSLKSEHTTCPHCGMPVGESRFDSNRGYTGAQTKLRPGQAVRVNNSYGNHYSTAFNVESDRRADDLPSDEDSSYRAASGAGVTGYGKDDDREPLFDSEDPWKLKSEEEEVPAKKSEPEKRSFRSMFLRREEEKSESEPSKEADDEDFEELTEEEKNSIRLSDGPAAPANVGISEDVRRFMTGLREENERRAQEQQRKAARKKAKKQADEEKDEDLGFEAYDEDEAPKKAKNKKAGGKKAEEDFDGIDFEPAEEEERKETKPAAPKKPGRKQIRVAKEYFRHSKPEEDFDDFDPDAPEEEEDLDEEYAEEFDDDAIDEELRRSNRLRVLRMVLAGASALLLLVIGILIFKNIRAKTGQNAPVPDVTKQLWDSGVETMQARMGDDYREQMLATASYDHLRVSMTNDLDGLGALLPSDRQLNDQMFIDALKQIQVNINARLKFDWKMKYERASLSGDMTASQMEAESAQGWQDVKDQFQALVDAKSKGELERVKNWDVKVDSDKPVQEPTPTPKPQEQSYKKLATNSSGDEVKNLQERLIELGYLASGQADGKFGNKTKTAVQLFQQAVGLEASGIADEETQRKLFSNDAPMKSN